MPYIIDGHNLIPKIPGLQLSALDDELQLIELLVEFCSKKRKQAEVYFDKAPPGQPKTRNFGSVKARFIREGSSADAAIQRRLASLGKNARNYTVVSSDQEVQEYARQHRAHFISSEIFASFVIETINSEGSKFEDKTDLSISQSEVDVWLEIFDAPPED